MVTIYVRHKGSHILAILTFALLSAEAIACFPPRMHTTVDYPTGFFVPRESFTPAPPRVSLLWVKRGDDSHPCSHYGSLEFELDERIHPDIAGYKFRLASGWLPEDALPDAIVRPADLGDQHGRFRFHWTDVAISSKHIHAVVEVVAVARDGVEGRPTSIIVKSPPESNSLMTLKEGQR